MSTPTTLAAPHALLVTTDPSVAAGLSFEQLRDFSWRSAEHGDLQEALRFCDEAIEIAQQSGDLDLLDLAYCNRSPVMLTLGRQKEIFSELRQILIRGRNLKNCFLAAYNLSRAYELDKSLQKGLFYARIARDRAQALGRRDWMASSHNQIANCLLAESYFATAEVEYQQALDLIPAEPSIRRAVYLVNFGCCKMMQGNLRDGFAHSFQALRWFRTCGAKGYEVWPHLDLCYAYIEVGRLDRARRHGQKALDLAERAADPTTSRLALFLLGETARAEGDHPLAFEYFSRLQQEHYPDSPQLAQLMVAVSMRQAINLRA